MKALINGLNKLVTKPGVLLIQVLLLQLSLKLQTVGE